nr:hypothetical protein [Tanacetum cinerariifolium]
MYKLYEDMRNIREQLAEYIDSPIWNCPIFFYDEDEEYTIQYREYLEKSPDAVTTILPTEEPKHLLKSDFVESLLNRDTYTDFSSKFDFSDELAHIKPKIPKFDFDFEEEIRLIENLLYDNSFLRSPEELNA